MKIKKLSWLLLLLLTGNLLFAQDKYNKPALEQKGSWSMIMIPDIQNYVKWNRNQPVLDMMMAWIEDNIDTLNIKMVVCTGDLVEQNDIINRGEDGDQSAQRQWETSARAFSRLDGKVPYITATGNHDYSIDRQGRRNTRFNDFFSIDKNWQNRKLIVQNTTNEAGQPTIENSAYELKSMNGKDYLFITVEYGPRDTVLAWARRVAEMKQYKDHRIVLLTHAFLSEKDQRTAGEIRWIIYEPFSIDNKIQKSDRIKMPFANNGTQIWEKLVQPASYASFRNAIGCGQQIMGYRTRQACQLGSPARTQNRQRVQGCEPASRSRFRKCQGPAIENGGGRKCTIPAGFSAITRR